VIAQKRRVGQNFNILNINANGNTYHNIRSDIPEGPDIDSAGRRRKLEDIFKAILKK
jgi:hypothetical protein